MHGAAAGKWRVRRLTNASSPVIKYENLPVGIAAQARRVEQEA